MKARGNGAMGRVLVKLEISNYHDMHHVEDGVISPEEVRRVEVDAVVDTGAAYLVLPKAVVRELGLASAGSATVRYADGSRKARAMARDAHIKLLGREATFEALVEPGRDTVLIGAIVLERLDLLVDCKKEKIYPRDPHRIIAEVE